MGGKDMQLFMILERWVDSRHSWWVLSYPWAIEMTIQLSSTPKVMDVTVAGAEAG